jgi:hypothetical protein
VPLSNCRQPVNTNGGRPGNRPPVFHSCNTCYSYSPCTSPARLYRHAVAMIRTPYASYTLIDTLDWLVHPLHLLAAGISEVFRPLENLEGFHILHTNVPLASVDILADNDGVFPWSGGDDDLDLGMRGRKLREEGLDEGAGGQV